VNTTFSEILRGIVCSEDQARIEGNPTIQIIAELIEEAERTEGPAKTAENLFSLAFKNRCT
jgi:hypothetical protein